MVVGLSRRCRRHKIIESENKDLFWKKLKLVRFWIARLKKRAKILRGEEKEGCERIYCYTVRKKMKFQKGGFPNAPAIDDKKWRRTTFFHACLAARHRMIGITDGGQTKSSSQTRDRGPTVQQTDALTTLTQFVASASYIRHLLSLSMCFYIEILGK
jgi:hypothetical protein